MLFLFAHLHVDIAERAAESTPHVSSMEEGRVEFSADNKDAIYMEYEETGTDVSHPFMLDLDAPSPRGQVSGPPGSTQVMIEFRPLFFICNFFAWAFSFSLAVFVGSIIDNPVFSPSLAFD